MPDFLPENLCGFRLVVIFVKVQRGVPSRGTTNAANPVRRIPCATSLHLPVGGCAKPSAASSPHAPARSSPPLGPGVSRGLSPHLTRLGLG